MLNDRARTDEAGCDLAAMQSKASHLSFFGPYSIKLAAAEFFSEMGATANERTVKRWERFISAAEQQGCIYRFTSDDASWVSLSGVRGFALVWGGEMLDAVITKRN